MLRIYHDVQAFQIDDRVLYVQIARHDADLARQFRRAAQSVALNLAEGMAQRNGRRRNAWNVAIGEARECVAAIEVARNWTYIEASTLDRLDKIVATLWNFVRA